CKGHMDSSCRHIPGTAGNVSEAVVVTKGQTYTSDDGRVYKVNGKPVMTRAQMSAIAGPYVQEHTDLIECIRGAKPINELKQVAESTLTAIMGRMSAYTGKVVSWEAALNSKLDTFPQNLTWDTKLPVDPVPVPGKT